MSKNGKKIRKGTLFRVLKVIKRRLPLLFCTIFCAAVYVLASVMIPVFVGDAVDYCIGEGQVDFVKISEILLKIALFTGLAALAQYIMNLLNNKITYGTVADLRRHSFEHIQKMPFAYLDKMPTGDIVSRITSDTEQLGDGLLTGFTQLFTGVTTIVVTLVVMLIRSPLIAAVVVVLTPLSLIAARLVAKRTYGFFRDQASVRGEQTAYTNEMISGQKTVQAFSHGDTTQKEFDEINERFRKISLKAVFWSSLTNPVTRFVNSIVYAAVALVGALSAIADPTFTVGLLTRMLSYANQYTKPFNEISGVITELQGALAAAERLFELIDEPQEIPDADGTLVEVDGRVTLENVSFSYTEEQSLIEDLSLDIKPGMKVAIVGPTGCGKTTLINLLMRFYDVKGGCIRVDSKDIRTVSRASLRSSYGMVLQDTYLMPGTVRENIAMGKPDATDEEIERAARDAHAHRFIMRLPRGYDTEIGDTAMLSEGERQLLCIARVMLLSPPMMILDEATSSIDTRTEIKIKKCFDALTVGHTSFMVAHRLSTILDSDLILVMKSGKVVERGTHKELLEKNGFYAELWNSGKI